MRFKHISIKNYKSYGDYTTRIDLDEKDTRLLIGDNGAGKTTFIDAIIWALYGKSLSPVEEVVNRITKRDCKVEVGFNIGQANYSCVRFRNHSLNGNKILVFKDNKDISLRTANDTQKLIDDIIQIQYNAMVSGILYSSEIYISFLRARPSERLKIFDSILSLKEIHQYHEIVKKMRKPITEGIENFKQVIDGYEVEIKTLKHSIDQYKEKIKNTLIGFKFERDEIEKEKEEIIDSLKNIETLNVEEELKKNVEYTVVASFNEEVNGEIEIEDNKKQNIDSLVEELDKIKIELDELSDIDIQEETLMLDNHQLVISNNSNIKNAILKLEATLIDVDAIDEKIKSFKLKVTKLEAENKEFEENIEICPTCKQEVSSDIVENLIHKNEKKIASIEIELYDLTETKRINNIYNKNTFEEIEKTRLEIEAEINEPEYDREFLNSLNDKKFGLNKRKDELSLRIITAEEKNKEATEKIKQLKESLKELTEKPSYTEEYLNGIKEDIDEKKDRVKEIEIEVMTINEKAKSAYNKTFIDDLNIKITTAGNHKNTSFEKMNKFMNEDLYYEVLQQLFSNQSVGIKKYIINRMMGVFNERVNFYIPFFFNKEISIKFDKDLNEEIKIGNTKVSFNTFSSGEKTRLELAIAFSLFMLVKTFFSTTINLLVFDEVLDMNLDNEGVLSVLNIIDNLSRDNSIIVISHRNEYKEYFANQILIKKDSDGFSKLVR